MDPAPRIFRSKDPLVERLFRWVRVIWYLLIFLFVKPWSLILSLFGEEVGFG